MNKNNYRDTRNFKYTDKLSEIAKEFAFSKSTIEIDEEIDDRHLIEEINTNRRKMISTRFPIITAADTEED